MKKKIKSTIFFSRPIFHTADYLISVTEAKEKKKKRDFSKKHNRYEFIMRKYVFE